ncbi:type I polyketide synthase [Streptomyces syringium]|uniref:Enediyne polyketide synthase n=1 Tax=Streptomyces syringium TaxID=76729 RepID=A0ABS4XXP1_9ACTN|nr:type I polyketide synthase [Streptomyces syringium]MBP2401160.1 enediyne polyketide synthase [Streptomyces syringium]
MKCSVAVVGMACRYPDADDPAALWQTVLAGRRAFRRIPPERLPLADYGPGGADGIDAERAAVLEGWSFDRAAFRVPGPAYRAADLTHWLTLDVAAAALRDAGFAGGEGLDRDRVGVVIGNSLTGEFSRTGQLRLRWPYVRRTVERVLSEHGTAAGDRVEILHALESRYKQPFPVPGDESLVGGLANTISGRVCNHFGFHGAGYTVDAACASSLVSVITACTALAQGDLDLALAGGVDLSLDPFELVGFSRLGALAHGPMRVYDRRPTGFLPGEGCGVLVLAREADAVRLGLRTYARIEGWGMSSDGRGGLTRPEHTGQALALRRAYERAGFGPQTAGLVEGHGTGTTVGDRVELAVLDEALRAAGARPARPTALGSVKANIGHTKAAAGVAGLIKAVLAVHHGVVPPTTGCDDPHELLAGPDPVLRVPTAPEPWPDGLRYRRASVNSAGFGGINAHVVVEGRAASRTAAWGYAPAPGPEVFPLSGDDPGELARRLHRLAGLAETLSEAELTDTAAELARRADPARPLRVAVVATSPVGLARRLRAAAAPLGDLARDGGVHWDARGGVFAGAGPAARLGLLLPGQGAPERTATGALGRLVAVGDLVAEVPDLPPGRAASDTAVVQPAVVAASLAGLRYLRRLGVRADAVAGHSLGELTALSWAGALGPAAAVALARARGALMARHGDSGGGMLAVGTDATTAKALLEHTGAVIAAVNGPRHVTVAGPRPDLARVRERAVHDGVSTVPLAVSHAFHTSAMRPALPALTRCFAAADFAPPSGTVISTVTGAALAPDTDLAALLTRQILSPVRYAEAVRALTARVDVLLEVGPGTMLTALTQPTTALPVMALDTTATTSVAAATAALFAACAADVTPWTADRFSRPIDLDRPREFLTNPCETDRIPSHGADAGIPDGPAAATTPAETAAGAPAPPSRDPYPESAPHGSHARSGPGEDATGSTLEAVRRIVAKAVELAEEDIGDDDLLLADLHVNSLRLAQIVAESARATGRAVPGDARAQVTASVAGLAAYVDGLPVAEGADEGADVAGAGPWVRAFTHRLEPSPPPEGGARVPYTWTCHTDGHPSAGAVRAAFPGGGPGPQATLVALPPGLGDAAGAAGTWVAAVRAVAESPGPVVLLHHRGPGAVVARSVLAERPGLDCLVVDVPAHAEGVRRAAAEAARGISGYAEVVFDDRGHRHVPVTAYLPLPPPDAAAIPLGAEDVCLVTGGAKGIGAETALALGRATGARLALLGRARPDADPVVAATLRRFADEGLTALYLAADVTDPAAVRRRVAEAEARLGPVTAVLHCAGRNEPGRLEALTPERLRAAVEPKCAGLDAVLGAVDTGRLRLLVAYGSVIARIGLPGESDYALANDLLRHRVEELSVALPHCRCLTVEWSQWEGAGMAHRLGAVETLRRQGVAPIPVADGTRVLLSLLAAPGLPPTVMVAGRLPRAATLHHADESLPLLRFLETPVVHQPGVEVVADAEVGLGTDPYLADHALDGVPLLPAVVGLEAMAQAAAAVVGRPAPSAVTSAVFERPVTVPSDGSRTVRVAALRHDDGTVETVLRSSETGFTVDHFRASYRFGPEPSARERPGARAQARRSPYYGDLFFHGPRFRGLIGYRRLTGRRCEALVAAGPDGEWFSGFHSSRLLLGDPGVRDTYVHLLQGCVPHRRVLPVGVEAVRFHGTAAGAGTVVVHAHETGHDADGYCYDLRVEDLDGSVLETWHGLRLKDVGPLPRDDSAPWPEELLGPYLTRSLDRLLPSSRVDVVTVRTTAGAVEEGEKTGFGSVAHLRDRALRTVADRPVAVDWADVTDPLPGHWRVLLGPRAAATAEEVSRATGEPLEYGCSRLLACRQTLLKLGARPDVPLRVERRTDDGWVLLRHGQWRVATVVVRVAGLPVPVAVAVCAGPPVPAPSPHDPARTPAIEGSGTR